MKPFKMEYIRLRICTSRAAEINHITIKHWKYLVVEVRLEEQ